MKHNKVLDKKVVLFLGLVIQCSKSRIIYAYLMKGHPPYSWSGNGKVVETLTVEYNSCASHECFYPEGREELFTEV